MSKLTAIGSVGCVPEGKSRGIVTLSTTPALPAKALAADAAAAFKSACENKTAPTITEALAQFAPGAPPSLSATYSKYYQQCESDRAAGRGGQPRPTAGDGATPKPKDETPEAKKAREEAERAKKAKEEAAKKLTDAAAAQQKAKDEAAKKQAELDAAKARNAGQSEIQQLEDDLKKAQGNLDTANQALDVAAADYAQVTAQRNKAVTDYAKALGLPPYQKRPDPIQAAYADAMIFLWNNVIAAPFDFMHIDPDAPYRDPQYCVVAECEYTSCHHQATVQAWRDELAKHKRTPCVGGQRPNDAPCFDSVLGGKPLDEAAQQHLASLACEERKKYMSDDFGTLACPAFRDIGGWTFDPCNNPAAMCAPEDSRIGSTSTALPGPAGGGAPGVGAGSAASQVWVSR